MGRHSIRLIPILLLILYENMKKKKINKKPNPNCCVFQMRLQYVKQLKNWWKISNSIRGREIYCFPFKWYHIVSLTFSVRLTTFSIRVKHMGRTNVGIKHFRGKWEVDRSWKIMTSTHLGEKIFFSIFDIWYAVFIETDEHLDVRIHIMRRTYFALRTAVFTWKLDII